MGADCCGADLVAETTEQMGELKVNVRSQQQLQAPGPRPWPELVSGKLPYYKKRVEIFDKIKAEQDAAMEAAKQANFPIKVILPDGTEKTGVKWVTTPMDIANQLSKSLAKKAIVAKVDGELWDMIRPLEGDCALQILSFTDPDGKEVGASPQNSIPAACVFVTEVWAA
jgi:hypothetical protein